MFDANRRKYPRANCHCLLTIWQPNGPNEIILADTLNIGVGGLAVHLHQSVELGTMVDVQIHFSNPSTPFRCKGTVVRCLKEGDKLYNTGIQFEPLPEIKFAFLDGKVSELIEQEKKGKG